MSITSSGVPNAALWVWLPAPVRPSPPVWKLREHAQPLPPARLLPTARKCSSHGHGAEGLAQRGCDRAAGLAVAAQVPEVELVEDHRVGEGELALLEAAHQEAGRVLGDVASSSSTLFRFLTAPA